MKKSRERRQSNRRAHNTALWKVPEDEIAFLCECDDSDCPETVPLPPDGYRAIVEAGGRLMSTACLERSLRSAPREARATAPTEAYSGRARPRAPRA